MTKAEFPEVPHDTPADTTLAGLTESVAVAVVAEVVEWLVSIRSFQRTALSLLER